MTAPHICAACLKGISNRPISAFAYGIRRRIAQISPESYSTICPASSAAFAGTATCRLLAADRRLAAGT